MTVVLLDVCRKEIANFPKGIMEDFVDALTLLGEGIMLNMPLSKPMPNIGKNIHELRLKDKGGVYRIFYVVKKKDAIYVIHAFQKKTQKTPKKNIDIVKKRIRKL